jgi:hypothetical protein
MAAPSQRQHRVLDRHRQCLKDRTSVRRKIRHFRSNYNADRRDLFSMQGSLDYIEKVELSDAERTVILQLRSELEEHETRLGELTERIKAFMKKAPKQEAKAWKIIVAAPSPWDRHIALKST